jgi:hypothetical protein
MTDDSVTRKRVESFYRVVAHIAAIWFAEDHPAYPIIATAFGDGA